VCGTIIQWLRIAAQNRKIHFARFIEIKTYARRYFFISIFFRRHNIFVVTIFFYLYNADSFQQDRRACGESVFLLYIIRACSVRIIIIIFLLPIDSIIAIIVIVIYIVYYALRASTLYFSRRT